MKNGLYLIFNFVFEKILAAIQFIGNSILEIISYLFNGLYFALFWVFKKILELLSKERAEHAKQVLEQESLSKEFEILVYVNKLKEDALDGGTWTSNHSHALSQLSQRLYVECDWSLKKIHSYMKTIVESIPGLSYVSGNDEDEDDDDYDDEDDIPVNI